MTASDVVYKFATRAESAGAAEYVACTTCGAQPGTLCTFETVAGPVPTLYGHEPRWKEYALGRGLLYGEPTSIPPSIWRSCQLGFHENCLPHPPSCQCRPPEPCECPCHKKFTANVDDLLG